MPAKFTFFEAAQQHGYIVSLMGPRVNKSRERCQIIIDHTRGRVFQVFKTAWPDKVYFEYVIPERETTESSLMWRAKAKQGLDKAWKAHLALIAETRALRDASSGAGTSDESGSPASRIESSSTGAPPSQGSSRGESIAEAPVIADSGLPPSTPASSPTAPPSSTASARASGKSGSKSRSSAGASTAKSG